MDVRSVAIAKILSTLNDECGRLNDLDLDKVKDDIRIVLKAYNAIGKIRAEDVPMDRLYRINNEGGALSWCGHSFCLHPDRCECQGDDPIPHRHYDYAPYNCARCGRCNGYSPVRDGAPAV